MIMITIYSILYIFFICLDYLKLVRGQKTSIKLIYLSITFLTYILIILIGLNIPISNPNNLIEKIVTTIMGTN